MCKISISMGRTVNDGNYGSYRAEVSFETDVNVEEVESAYVDIENIVLSQLERTLLKVKEDV